MEALIDQTELRDSARRVLEKHADRMAFLQPSHEPGAFDPGLWQLIAELGWLGLSVPEEQGGLGQPFPVLATLYFELGRALCAQPFTGATIGIEALSHSAATAVAAPLVEAGLSGEAIIVTIATGSGALATRAHGGVRVIEGTVTKVVDAAHATHLLVPIEGENPALGLVALPHPAVVVTPLKTWDLTRRVADVEFNGLELGDDDLILRGDAALAALARMRAHFDLALACDALGGAEAAFEETLVYLHQRHQFNRPIASFQAIKHRCAEHKVAIEASRALVDAACRAAVEPDSNWLTKAACARLYAGAVYRTVTEDSVQLHGGIGFTWEYPCHLFLKRARLGDVLGGSIEKRKDRVAPSLFGMLRRDSRVAL